MGEGADRTGDRRSAQSARSRTGLDRGDLCRHHGRRQEQGLLRGRQHTSNALDVLRAKVPGYSEANGYVDAPAVRDRGLITASGLGDVEFARELFEEFEVLRPQDRAAWAQIFRSGRMPQVKA